jgi:acetoin utilization protein AcuB
MKVKDIMTWNVITVSGDTPIMEARKIMETHRVRRLPVVDKGKLVGVVTLDRIVGVGPSPATSLSVWEINYLLAKMKVREVMQKDVVSVGPEVSVEQALARAQAMKVGAAPVVEDGKVVGIITTNDFMLKLLNPALGIGKPGSRLNISNANKPKNVREIMEILEKMGLNIVALHTVPAAEDTTNGLSLHVDADDPKALIKELEAKGYKSGIVAR